MKVRNLVALRRDDDTSCANRRHDSAAGRCRLSKSLTSTIGLRSVVAALALTCFLLGSRAAHADIILQLSERGSPWTYGAGARGLYLGHDFTYTTHGHTNFKFQNVEMRIFQDSGNVEITGEMQRGGGPVAERLWNIQLNLFDIEFKKPDGSYVEEALLPPIQPLTEMRFDAFLAGENPYGPEDWSGLSDWGFEWQSLTLELEHPVGSSAIPLSGWTGFAMPEMGHNFVAELHYDSGLGGLTFEAWYRHDDMMRLDGYYNTGDTKSIATYSGTTRTGGSVPEPSAYALALVAALALMAIRYGATRR